MENNDKPAPKKVLLMTYEYGRHVTGGLGRVVNGIFNNMSNDNIILDIFLLKSPFPGLVDPLLDPEDEPFYGYLYRKDEQNKAKRISDGEYKMSFRKVMETGDYDILNTPVSGKAVCWCINEIKTNFPKIKIVYSCHSLAKHEIKIRNNRATDLALEDFILNNADHIQVLNQASLRYLTECYPDVVSKKQISIIPNGINEVEYGSIDAEFRDNVTKLIDPDKDILVFCLSRWSFGKGLEHLIEAIPKILETKNNVKFIIAGRKTQSWENKVEDYVEMIDKKIEGLHEHIIPMGWLDNKQRNTMFSMAHICIMPSLLEYFPYGILEPMVCKVPIISSNIDSVAELLEEDTDCLFFTPENPNELAEKILYLIENKHKSQELSENAYQKVKSNYNWEAISLQYADMYQSL